MEANTAGGQTLRKTWASSWSPSSRAGCHQSSGLACTEGQKAATAAPRAWPTLHLTRDATGCARGERADGRPVRAQKRAAVLRPGVRGEQAGGPETGEKQLRLTVGPPGKKLQAVGAQPGPPQGRPRCTKGRRSRPEKPQARSARAGARRLTLTHAETSRLSRSEPDGGWLLPWCGPGGTKQTASSLTARHGRRQPTEATFPTVVPPPSAAP